MRKPVSAMLGYLERLCHTPEAVTPADAEAVLAADVSEDMFVDAVYVCALFSIYTRLADTFDFTLQRPEHLAAQARMLLKLGYLL